MDLATFREPTMVDRGVMERHERHTFITALSPDRHRSVSALSPGALRSLSDLTDRHERFGLRDKFIDLMRRIARYLTNQIE
ncbi:hypothetical protein LOKO_03624 [Halomonas chromatireducens]|uniref:Uncharacterized protein n=1 Tax=Halomonas chromatireducens TaxID=507626 RepID=A0A120JWW8_9GAMM|nr:hypothetical protein LOKO_03624 [Halomonas chromatireducens]